MLSTDTIAVNNLTIRPGILVTLPVLVADTVSVIIAVKPTACIQGFIRQLLGGMAMKWVEPIS